MLVLQSQLPVGNTDEVIVVLSFYNIIKPLIQISVQCACVSVSFLRTNLLTIFTLFMTRAHQVDQIVMVMVKGLSSQKVLS